ncbi:MAG TPA: putative quinol monooxygenase [Candidatus Dormibacteraeota bacterium]|nr:putative quinol monooxygenase [Candidatus Dormibacteraeota bacterium]
MFALIVSLRIRPERRNQFLQAAEENSTASVRDEPGCLRFDVVHDQAEPDHFFYYEVYTDEAAFDAHKKTPHYARWRQAAAECVAEGAQQNTRCDVLFPRDYR